MASKRYLYVQNMEEGLASYNLAEKSSWISYANALDSWKLDNGEKIPEKNNSSIKNLT